MSLTSIDLAVLLILILGLVDILSDHLPDTQDNQDNNGNET